GGIDQGVIGRTATAMGRAGFDQVVTGQTAVGQSGIGRGAIGRWVMGERTAKILLIVASLSIVLGMVLAGAYAVGEFTEKPWLSIPQMAVWHGIANAWGFSTCGLLAWVL